VTTELQTPGELRELLQQQFRLRLDELPHLDARLQSLFPESP
jgi:hypothetical protein